MKLSFQVFDSFENLSIFPINSLKINLLATQSMNNTNILSNIIHFYRDSSDNLLCHFIYYSKTEIFPVYLV